MINKLARGEARESAHIYAIAKALGVTPEYLSGDSEEISGDVARHTSRDVRALDEDEIVEIKELDLAFGMGGGSYLDLPVKEKGRKIARDWLRLYTNSPASRIFLARGIGDSMSPTIQNDDVVIIDTAQTLVGMGDQIWAISYGNFGLIKRLRPLPSGGIKIMSDNPHVESEVAYDGELHPIGKVVAIIRKMAGS
ncbi:hypothetical protein A8V01_02635 [Novosphingobium guangzhouense]|uniref:HTH cro/C1-type domain-containing protein n=2 Tax=Novosphingobium guangzhouense TaxID=1850347 RepID=A0A2K2G600_9SPHN|nr:hypothetical protein A8V01_02635 [Novosphingobium guangzhouense]